LLVKKKECEEAILAGRGAANTVFLLKGQLSSAGNWSTLDILGGGLGADVMKYERLDTAQELIERLQDQLRRFHTELKGVFRSAERLALDSDRFLQFADMFFDGFASWSVHDKIESLRREVEIIANQLEAELNRLRTKKQYLEAAYSEKKQEWESLLLQK